MAAIFSSFTPLTSTPLRTVLYHPLSDQRREIRLLKVLPQTDSPAVHCCLVTHSLQEVSAGYRDFLAKLGSDATLRTPATIKKWIESRVAPKLAKLDPLKRITSQQPSSDLLRFIWGDFAALSYVWGDQAQTRWIFVNGQQVQVTTNLERALRQFRDEGEFSGYFMLWIDALCINQHDLDERACQIQRMREIYGAAWTVIAWVGEESSRSHAAFQLVRDLVAFKEAVCVHELEERLREDPHFLGPMCWLGLHELMDRPYWYRLWVIQEIVMGSTSVWIRCGKSKIDWTTFCSGIAILQEHLWLVKDHCLLQDIRTARVNITPTWKTTSLHLVYQDLSVLSQTLGASSSELPFGRLLDLANSADCTNKRDKVYALIGLLPPLVARRIQPDYTLPLSSVYARAARAFIQVYENLEPLREGNPWGPADCPSWVADWLWPGRRRHSRVEQQLWGPAYLFPRDLGTANFVPYRANGETRYQASFSNDGLLLSCKGFIVDRISGLSARGVGYFSWDMGTIVRPHNYCSIYGTREATAEALFRTLIADRVSGGQKATSRHAAILRLPATFAYGGEQFAERGWNFLAGQKGYYFRWEFFRAAIRDFPLGDCSFDHFFDDELPMDAEEYDYTEVYSCFDRSSQKRRFITTEKGYMGWAPDNIYGKTSAQTKSGDLVAIIFGCSTPLVVRPYGAYFQVLGEAYVQGLMDGEAMRDLQEGKYQTQTFTFC